MRANALLIAVPILTLSLIACPKKGPSPEPAEEAPAATPAPTPEPTPVPTPPPPTPEPASSDTMTPRGVTITLRDGSVHKGQLTRAARSDRFGTSPYEDRDHIDLLIGANIETATWDQVASMTNKTSSIPDADINCTYDAAATPVTIECSYKMKIEVKLVGKSDRYTLDDTYLWRFYLDGQADSKVQVGLGALYIQRDSTVDVLEDLVGTEEDTKTQLDMHEELKKAFNTSIKSVVFD